MANEEKNRSFEINLYSFKYKPGARQPWDKGRWNKSTDFHQEVTLRQQPPCAAKEIRPTRSVIGIPDNYLFSTNHQGTSFSLLRGFSLFLLLSFPALSGAHLVCL